MPTLNFTMFIDKVENGTKLHTIRADRKHPIKIGDRLYHYTGMRTKHCRRLGPEQGVECTEASDITIKRYGPRRPTAGDVVDVIIDGRSLSYDEVSRLAIADGFQNQEAFMDFFTPRASVVFHGQIIHWKWWGKTCTYCGEELNEEESESPECDEDGNVICDDCYHENYEWTCDCCGNTELKEFQHLVLVVFDPPAAELSDHCKAGLYQIVRYPYYADGMIEFWIIEDALKWVAPLPAGIESTGYPCGHLCRECIKKYAPMVALPKEATQWATN